MLNKIRQNIFLKIDIWMLVSILLILNVSLSIKLLGILILLARNYLFKRKKNESVDIPKFYFYIIIFSIVQYIIQMNYFETDEIIKKVLSIGYWGIAWLILYQLKKMINNQDLTRIKNTINLFFIINIFVSGINLLKIIFEIGEINPFLYAENDFQYHMSTGDYIKGITFDTSTTNAIICLFGFVYYLIEKKYFLSVVSLVVLLYTNSNFANLILLSILPLFFFKRGSLYKTLTVCFLGIIIVFYTQISPQSAAYIFNSFDPEYSVKLYHKNERKEMDRIAELNRKDSIIKKYLYSKTPHLDSLHQATINNHKDSSSLNEPIVDTLYEHRLNQQFNSINSFIDKHYDGKVCIDNTIAGKKTPGKVLSMIETLQYSTSSFSNFFIGSGAGNFSSKLAFKLSGVSDLNSDEVKGTSVSDEFKDNHLKIYCYYFSQDKSEHSALNTPHSVFNQILGEYGVIGLLLLVIFYIIFFVKRFKYLTYGKYLLIIIVQALFIDYWFEQLSIIILFELLMFIDLKTHQISEKLKPKS